MFDKSKYVSPIHTQGLDQWTRAWYGEAVEAGFIRRHYQLDPVTIKRLRSYFNAGLSPIEAAQACFGHKN